ncbi:MAG: hypothetical protein HKN16_01590 [Saprospiraceae bacterium]|nr:hypothetical protein [Saprospiraceae bacterium]
MATNSNNRTIWWITGLAGLIALLILGRGLLFILPMAIIPGLILVLAFGAYLYLREKEAVVVADDFTKEINDLVNKCNTELSDLNSKATRLARSKVELKEKLSQTNPPLDDGLKTETERLLAKFENESSVIQAKREFFRDMLDRANSLLANYRWKEKLKEKESELRDLKDGHYDDVATMEDIKHEMAYSRGFFDALNNLSNKIESSTETKSILELREELKTLIPRE